MRQLTLALLLLACAAYAEIINTSVQYVSATTIYLSAGRASGITPGDTVVISRSGSEVVRAVISFVSDKTASCELTDAATTVTQGDHATVIATGLSLIKDDTKIDSDAEVTLENQPAPTLTTANLAQANELSGRIGIQYTVQNDREPVNYDYTEPAMSLRASLARIGGSDFTARVNMKLRRTIRADNEQSASTNRIYEALLQYKPQNTPWEAGAGRLLLRETRGMGYLDGAYVKYDVTPRVSLGAVGGIEPDLQNTRIQSDVTKLGAFVAYKQKLSSAQSFQATASLAGRYLEGEISREFLYQQLAFVSGSKLRLFESTELNLNRNWLKDAEGSSLTLASILFDARYSFSRALALSLGYDDRANYYTAETRSIPDSLFNNAQQHGYRASVDSRFGTSYSAQAGIGIRHSDNNTPQASSGWFRLGTTDIFETDLSVFARLRWFDSEYSTGTQPSLYLSRSAVSWLRVGVEGGLNDYELNTTSDNVSQQWLALLLDFDVAKRTYASFEIEQGFGDGRDATLLNLSLGHRF